MLNYLHKILAKALLGVLVFGVVGCSGSIAISDLRSGDLLFVVNGQGNNITDVTDGVDGLGIDHVAVFSDGDVIEAIPKYGVVENPLDSFLVRLSDGESVLVGRIEGLDVEESVANARKFLGRPYDDIFMPSDSAIYCSELVQKSFVFKDGQKERDHNVKGIAVEATMACDDVKDMNPKVTGCEAKHFVFGTIPMSFHDSTGNVTEFWTKFYSARGLAVPEGEPGTNPGQLSRDPNVKILGRLQ